MDLGSNLTLIVLQTYTTGKSRYTVVISYANNIYSRIHSSILARIVTFIVHAKQFKIMQVKFLSGIIADVCNNIWLKIEIFFLVLVKKTVRSEQKSLLYNNIQLNSRSISFI